MENMIHRQVDERRVNNNIPMDHNWIQMFFEAMNPEMNANEVNDDDVAAINEQMMEFLQNGNIQLGGNNENGDVDEDGWQQDWDSDYSVCLTNK